MREIVQSILVLGLILTSFTEIGHANNASSTDKPKLNIQPVAGRFTHAEGPHWDHRSQKLYFVDIEEQKIGRFDPALQLLTSAYIKDGPVGFVIPVNGMPDNFVAGVARNFDLITWDADDNETAPTVQTLVTVDQDRPGNRWNDGKADSSGRFWGGTIGPEVNEVVQPNRAYLYSITDKLVATKEVSNVTNSNGLAWNIQDDTFYYIDTGTRQVAAFDYDPLNGTISNKRIVFDFAENNIDGYPDGMTIDTRGNLYIALFNGHRFVKVNPTTGKLLLSVRMPAEKVTSLTFGGPLLDTLYVTTSCRGLTAKQLEEQPFAGYIFAVKGLGEQGFMANSFRMRL